MLWLLRGDGAVLLGACAVMATAACSAPSREGSATTSAEILEADVSALEARVNVVGTLVEQRSGAKTYLAIDHFDETSLADRGQPVDGALRRAALLDCAIYGGGKLRSPVEIIGGATRDEDLDKYIDRATREELAAFLDESIGDAKVRRLDSFGVGDPGDDFSAKCTVSVENGAGRYLMLQGHGRDSFL